MEYIRKNMWDNSKVYKFENFREQAESSSNTKKDTGSSSENKKSRSKQAASSSQNPQPSKDDNKRAKNDENSSDEFINPNERDYERPVNKRILKMNKKNLTMLDDYQKHKDAQHKKQKEGGGQNVFKIRKVNDKGAPRQESPYNTSSEEQKVNSSNTSGECKTQNNASNTDSNNSTRPPTNYICLSAGKVIIKGNEIETTVPCDIETINNKISMISPHYPVKVTMYPLSYNRPHVYDPKSQSFTSKESFQSGGNQNGGSDGAGNPSNENNGSGFINLSSSSGYSSPFDHYMKMLEQNYCLGTCSVSKRLSTSTPSGGYTTQDQRVQRSASQAPMNYPHIFNNMNSGSSNRNSCESQLYKHNTSNNNSLQPQ